MKNLFIRFILCGLLFSHALAQEIKDKRHPEIKIDCKLCHLCAKPTVKDPCLKECPRFKEVAAEAWINNSPDVVIIDVISNLYVPVVFSHQLHAEMSDMSGGCAICHHNNPQGDILPCADCHSAEARRADLSKPGLKGAYHRQCLSCHREWSHSTECSICHALKSTLTEKDDTADTTDIVGIDHPPIPQPDKILYATESDQGEQVTFYHDEHIELYGLTCVNCHKEESCGRCHDLSKPTLAQQLKAGKAVSMRSADDDYHAACFGCHEDNECRFCHAQTEQKPFNHMTRTGWRLKRYHQTVSCQNCHRNRPDFSGLKSRCQHCHKGWNSETFNHKIVGLSLDENHIDNDCSDCHSGSNYAIKPSCDNCHDQDIVYPAFLPGKKIN